MKLQRKGTRHSHRGVIGVESAIVMIAFVIVAAALAFVVLNMGFSTTQKAKTTILSGLAESSSSLEVSGKITGVGCTTSGTCATTPVLNATAIPIKITSGGDSVELSAATTTVSYVSNSIQYTDIYAGPLAATTEYRSLSDAFDGAASASLTGFTGRQPITGAVASQTSAFVYWSVTSNTNAILDQGEHAVLAVGFASADRPAALDKIRAEIIVSTGASLTVERQVPNITTSVVDLG
ncbi:archaellin/type IV pilin N-terminal domain-containing protein [Candidatus Nitrosarchaeum limnium]|jgi:flagellin FlaB|uniref:Flagellin n=1 Tax=Candidatus Nitrosarchaeum limnium BG20 TaxID=859192 RepID=S2E554_9ARCH|nr:archaellin/type IV pilin N-terminal domain-containing protein [Candidatus Nitrosarchaeum limnium]EPA06340.1 archaeal flagellin N-terminal-like domain protein [Candidatus Nitrosarchaeum limnium BG20]